MGLMEWFLGQKNNTPTEKHIYCPSCGSEMIKRKSRPGLASKFWYGCGNYPACKSIVLDINLKDKHFIKMAF